MTPEVGIGLRVCLLDSRPWFRYEDEDVNMTSGRVPPHLPLTDVRSEVPFLTQ